VALQTHDGLSEDWELFEPRLAGNYDEAGSIEEPLEEVVMPPDARRE
jgi:hypothetical protein